MPSRGDDVESMQPYLGKDGWGCEVVDKNRYEGDFKDGLPHGRGKKTWAHGDTYGRCACRCEYVRTCV